MSRMLSRALPRLRFGGGVDDNLVCGDPDVVKAYTSGPIQSWESFCSMVFRILKVDSNGEVTG